MEAKLFVLESEASGLKEDLPVSLSLDFEPGRVFTGKLAGLDTVAKPLSEDSPSSTSRRRPAWRSPTRR